MKNKDFKENFSKSDTNTEKQCELKQELLKKIKVVEVNKKDGLVFFGRCHCSGNGGVGTF